jgi:hypothetical protein
MDANGSILSVYNSTQVISIQKLNTKGKAIPLKEYVISIIKLHY